MPDPITIALGIAGVGLADAISRGSSSSDSSNQSDDHRGNPNDRDDPSNWRSNWED